MQLSPGGSPPRVSAASMSERLFCFPISRREQSELVVDSAWSAWAGSAHSEPAASPCLHLVGHLDAQQVQAMARVRAVRSHSTSRLSRTAPSARRTGHRSQRLPSRRMAV
jgi:hypothetical protein